MEPVWPASFDLLEGDLAGWRFAVGQPGPVHVTVQATGVPIVVQLRRPDGVVLERSGGGSVTLDATATPADVQRGVLWGLTVRGVAPPPPRDGLPRRLKPGARGTVAVSHPPGDPKRVRAEMDVGLRAAQAQAAQDAGKARSSPSGSLAAKRRAELDRQTALRRAQFATQLRPEITPAAYQLLERRIQAGTAGLQGVSQVLGRAAGGSNQASVTPAQQPPPVFQSTSVSEGRPGDPLLLTGSRFGEATGEVHFLVANDKDLVSPVAFWSDGQIVAEVPYADGIRDFNGYVYVRRSDGVRSAVQPFRFQAPLDVHVIGLPIFGSKLFDARPNDTLSSIYFVAHDLHFLFGGRGDDEFYLQTKLINGWVVETVQLTDTLGLPGPRIWGSASATIVDFRPGTDSPYVRVHWWGDALSEVWYRLAVTLVGPRCLPPFASTPGMDVGDVHPYVCTAPTP